MRRIAAWCLFAILISTSWTHCLGEASSPGLVMLCLNVGKADCILLSVEGRHYLVDTGYAATSDRLLEMLAHEQVASLDGVLITHNHKDHVGGLSALVDSSVRIDAFYAPAFCTDAYNSRHPAYAAAARRGQALQTLRAGDRIPITDSAWFDVLAPDRLNTDNENNNSLVVRLVSPDGSILLTGDMKFEEEYLLLKAATLTATDVLKVGFHGDDTSTSSSFLSAVRPRVAVICTSTAEEPDTPAKDTLFRLASFGCTTFVTQDAASAVRVVLSDGHLSVDLEDWHTE